MPGALSLVMLAIISLAIGGMALALASWKSLDTIDADITWDRYAN